ncbi:hypothetical protein SDC9_183094 [bioreactor metagenome]|uniref:Alpha-D-glucose 1-phosphate phosphatase YihX n=1 Tax=bioreactor metagenome TaxID=1076179 RepID=A0A645HAQ3_9ZZZZ
MIKNVIFDFGNVICRFDPEAMARNFCENDEDAKLLADTLFEPVVWEEMDKGFVDMETYGKEMIPQLPERLHKSAENLLRNWFYHIPEIDGMRELLIKLKEKGIKLYILSNICNQFADHYQVIDIFKLFDGLVFSCTINCIKPNDGIYLHLIEKYTLNKTECVFVDDRKINIEAAIKLDIEGYIFDGDVQKLEQYLFDVINH